MSEETARAFRGACRQHRYRAGETIYFQGDQGTEMYQVMSGSVRLSVTHPDGRAVVVAFFEAGACFGNSSLVDQGPRPQTAEARSDTTLAVLTAAAFERLRATCRDFDSAFLRLLALQMRGLGESFARANLSNLATRLARGLLDAARTLETAEDGSPLTIRLSQSDIASMVGASRQTINRALGAMQQQGLIAIDYGKIVVLDEEALEGIAEEKRRLSD